MYFSRASPAQTKQTPSLASLCYTTLTLSPLAFAVSLLRVACVLGWATVHGVAGGTALSTASAASAGRGVQWAAWEREGGTLLVVLVRGQRADSRQLHRPLRDSNPRACVLAWGFKSAFAVRWSDICVTLPANIVLTLWKPLRSRLHGKVLLAGGPASVIHAQSVHQFFYDGESFDRSFSVLYYSTNSTTLSTKMIRVVRHWIVRASLHSSSSARWLVRACLLHSSRSQTVRWRFTKRHYMS